MARLVLGDIRGPRIVMACLTGAALAVAGTIMQGLFRNPLADPGLAGISSGAALAIACVMVLGGAGPWVSWLGRWAIPCAGSAGSFAGMGLLYLFATRGGVTSMTAIRMRPGTSGELYRHWPAGGCTGQLHALDCLNSQSRAARM